MPHSGGERADRRGPPTCSPSPLPSSRPQVKAGAAETPRKNPFAKLVSPTNATPSRGSGSGGTFKSCTPPRSVHVGVAGQKSPPRPAPHLGDRAGPRPALLAPHSSFLLARRKRTESSSSSSSNDAAAATPVVSKRPEAGDENARPPKTPSNPAAETPMTPTVAPDSVAKLRKARSAAKLASATKSELSHGQVRRSLRFRVWAPPSPIPANPPSPEPAPNAAARAAEDAA